MSGERPTERWQDAGALAGALLAATLPVRSRHSARQKLTSSQRRTVRAIAVLPFRNTTAPDHDYLAAGVTESLVTALAHVSELRVISQTSAVYVSDSHAGAGVNARQAGIDAWIEGTVTRSKDRVRVSVRLIHATTQEHLWAATYDRGLGDDWTCKQRLPRRLRQRYSSKVWSRRRHVKRAIDLRAQEAYLRGRFCWNQRSAEALKLSFQYFEAALKRDPDYALAHAGLAAWYMTATLARLVPPAEAITKAKTAATRALQLDPLLPEAHSCLGHVLLHEWDVRQAKRGELETAVQLNPNLAEAQIALARAVLVYEHD